MEGQSAASPRDDRVQIKVQNVHFPSNGKFQRIEKKSMTTNHRKGWNFGNFHSIAVVTEDGKDEECSWPTFGLVGRAENHYLNFRQTLASIHVVL